MKTLDWSLYPNFSRSEFECKCGCRSADMDPDFMWKLQELRDDLKQPVKITSGFRCENHPAEKKKKRGGAHSIGHAADIRISSARQLGKILVGFEGWGFKAVGVDKDFVHLDDKHPYLDRSKLVAWGY